ncbi:MAG: metal ABC transporter substrate-binding protein [Ruminococcus sp.]
MKKIIAIILALMLSLMCLSACEIKDGTSDSDKLKVIASIFPQYDFARQLTGDLAEVTMLVTPGAETHGFEPTTSDIIAVSKCDVFIYTGGESDSWIDGILEDVNNPDMTVVSLMDCVEPIEAEETSEEDADRNHQHEVDEHIWTSPVNSIKICEKITKALCEKDSINADKYNENLKALSADLKALDEDFREVTENAERNTLVFGDRFPLAYFAKEYGLECFSAFSGCSEDTEASASTVAFLIDKVKEENLPVVYKIELSSDSVAKTICEETGAQLLTFYSCHNISKSDFDSGETYLSLMQKNVESLKLALN